MNIKRSLIIVLLLVPQLMWAQKAGSSPNGLAEREYYVKTLTHIADPVLNALSRNELKKTMPVEAKVTKDRVYSTYLEAFGRLLAGMSPWLELGPDQTAEGKLRKKYIDLAVTCIKNATDPNAADYLNFNKGRQPLVDAAFFSGIDPRA